MTLLFWVFFPICLFVHLTLTIWRELIIYSYRYWKKQRITFKELLPWSQSRSTRRPVRVLPLQPVWIIGQVTALVDIITNVIKAHFPTLSYGSSSSLPPEINHKFTPQLPWRNCLQLQLSYQIIDRFLLGSTISDFMCFVGKDLCWSSFLLLSLALPCRVAGNTVILFSLSVFIHTGLLSVGWGPPFSAGQCTLYLQTDCSFR